MEPSELVVCTMSKTGEDDSEILQTPGRRKTDIWSYCNVTPQLCALESTDASTSENVIRRRKTKGISDYSVRRRDQLSTLNTPLKIYHADEEIEHLVNCMNVCNQNSPELKIPMKDSVTASSTNKKRLLLMPVQSLNASDFDPLSLFSEPPPDSVKKKRRRSSLKLTRIPIKGRNGILSNSSPVSNLGSPTRRQSKIPILRLSSRSPVLYKRRTVGIANDLALKLAKSRMKTVSTGHTVSCENSVEGLPTSHVMSKRKAARDLQVLLPKFIKNESKTSCDILEISWDKSTNEMHGFPISSKDTSVSVEKRPLNDAENGGTTVIYSSDGIPATSDHDFFEDLHSSESLDDACSIVAETPTDQSSLEQLRLDIVLSNDIGDSAVVGSPLLKSIHEITTDMNCDCVAIVRSSVIESSSVVEFSQPKTPNSVLWEVNCDSTFNKSTSELETMETTVLRQESVEQSKFHSQEYIESEFRTPNSNEYAANDSTSLFPDTFKTVALPAHGVEKDCDWTMECATAENTHEVMSEDAKFLPLDCVMFATKSFLWLDGIFEREITESRTVASTPSSPEMLEENVVQFEASSPPLTNGHAGENEAVLSQKAKTTAKRSSTTKTKIRRTVPKLEVRHTPMGLPKPIRVNKEKFSLEEIYLNKNFRTPTEKKWETIYEFPKENKDGSTSTYEKRKKKRRCDFMVDPSQRKVKWKKTKVKLKRKFQSSDGDIDKILSLKLFNLDNALELADLSP